MVVAAKGMRAVANLVLRPGLYNIANFIAVSVMGRELPSKSTLIGCMAAIVGALAMKWWMATPS